MTNRRVFLSSLLDAGRTQNYSRQLLSGLNPYYGPWSRTEAIHLLRRTMCGFKSEDIDTILVMGMEESLDLLLTIDPLPSPPLNNYNNLNFTDPDVPAGETWVNAPFTPESNPKRRASLNAWWMSQFLSDELNIREKMTLFWHNFLVTEADSVDFSGWIYKHNDLLRNNVLSNYRQLIKLVTIDPAMLRYLNGVKNNVDAPDENYARELLELFTCGKGPDSLYTEDDVKAAAKVLTGYRVNITTNTYFFQPNKHDTSDKQFSAFFNNTLIPGLSGADGELELDAMLDMIFAVDEVSKHFCRKLYRYFVYYKIDDQVETDIILPLAQIMRDNNYEVMPVIRALLSSEHFYDQALRSCFIKTPIDFVTGLVKTFRIEMPTNAILSLQYQAWEKLFTMARDNGQELNDPPSVAGWPAYYQEPMFHEIWINSDTISKRFSFIKLLIETGIPLLGNNTIQLNPLPIVEHLDNPFLPDALIDELVELLFAIPVSDSAKQYMKSSYLLSGQSTDNYWTEAWADYVDNPDNAVYADAVSNRLRGLFNYMLLQAEYQLS